MKGQNNPHVTVLMATYNGEKYLGEMIESVINQDYANWKLVISDDGSSDSTPRLIEEYSNKYPDKIERFISGKRFGGACQHFMYLIENIKDDYIMLCDQDDKWHTNKMRITMQKMLETEETKNYPVLIHTDLRVVDREMKEISHSFFRYSGLNYKNKTFPQMIMQNIVTGCTVMMNRRLADIAVNCSDRNSIIMHDWWLALCAAAFGRIGVVNEATIDYRQHGNNSVGAKNVYSMKYIAEKISKGNIRTDILKALNQGGVLGESFSEYLDTEEREICHVCSRIPDMDKLQREMAYIKYGILPDGVMRKLKVLVWG